MRAAPPRSRLATVAPDTLAMSPDDTGKSQQTTEFRQRKLAEAVGADEVL